MKVIKPCLISLAGILIVSLMFVSGSELSRQSYTPEEVARHRAYKINKHLLEVLYNNWGESVSVIVGIGRLDIIFPNDYFGALINVRLHESLNIEEDFQELAEEAVALSSYKLEHLNFPLFQLSIIYDLGAHWGTNILVWTSTDLIYGYLREEDASVVYNSYDFAYDDYAEGLPTLMSWISDRVPPSRIFRVDEISNSF